ncbi:MAG: ESPR-type extended signal peptide-containing protein, partial [Haemophilus parainfluenzae]|nr:ESPR-type extended signal peptide-containing protein [Haemophilus parainfluenzae]
MNKVFKVIWNHATQTWTAVSELGHAKGKTKSKKIVKLTALAGAVIGSLAVSQTATAASDLTTNDAVNISPNNVPNPTAGRQAVAVGAKANASHQDSIAIGTNATAAWTNTVSIGKDTVANQDHALAIATEAKASGVQSIAIGSYSNASADSVVSIGQNSKAGGKVDPATGKGPGTAAVAVGYLADASAANTVAAGKSATATVDNAVALGVSSSATNRNAAALGAYSKAAGERATAVGAASNAEGAASFAGGTSAKAIGDNSIAIGGATDMDDDEVSGKKQTGANAAKANGKKSIAIGFNATTSEYAADSVAMGTFANAKAASTVVIGDGALADEDARYSVVVGNTAKARDGSAVAIGRRANANAYDAIALGDNATASGISIGAESISSKEDSITLGHAAVSEGSETVTIGNSAWSKQDVSYAVTLGANAINSANYSTALGHAANTTAVYSVALGADSEAGKDFVSSSNATINGVEYENFAASTSSFNTENDEKEGGAVVSLGKKGYERQIKHVAAGQVTNVSTDAINGSQLYSVADALATKINKQHWNVGDNNGAVVNGVYHEDQVNFVNGTVTTVKVVDASSSGSAPGQKSGPNITNVSYDVNVGKGLKIENNKIVANFVAGNGVTFNEDGDKITINAQSTGGAASSVVSGNNDTLSVKQNATNPSEYIVTPITGSLSISPENKGKVGDDAKGKEDNGKKLTTIQTTRDMINKAHWNLQIGTSSDPKNAGESEITSADQNAEPIHAGDTVNFFAGKNIKLKRQGSDITISAKDASVDKGEIIPATNTTNTNNNGTVMAKDGDGDKFANITNVVNAINSAFWKIGEENSGKPEVKGNVTAGSQVNFSNGVGTIAKVTADEANKTYKVQYDVNAGPGIEISTDENDPNKGKVKVKVDNSTVTINNDGQLVANSAWNANATGNVDGTSAAKTVKANATVNFDAGENLKVKQTGDAANQVYSFSLNQTLTNITSIEHKAGGPKLTFGGNSINITGGNLDMGNNKITNLEPGTDDTDAVNLSQLKKSRTRTVVTSNDNSVTVTDSDSEDGLTKTYDLKVNLSNVAKSSWNVKSSAADGGAVTDNHNAAEKNIADKNTVEFKAGKNLTVEQVNGDNGANVTFALSNNITLDNSGSINIGGTTVKDGDIKIGDTHITNGAVSNLTHHIENATTVVDGRVLNISDEKKKEAATVRDVLNSGWNLQANGEAVDAVTHGNNVNFASDGSVKITPKTDGNTSTINLSVNATNVVNQVTGNVSANMTTGKAVVLDKDGNEDTSADAGNKVATVGDVANTINNTGWITKAKDKDTGAEKNVTVNPGDRVEYVDGKGTTANVTVTNTNGQDVVNVTYDVKTDGTTVTVNNDGNLTVVTGNITKASDDVTNSDAGKVTVNTGDDNKVATVKNVADAINSAGWIVNTGKADSKDSFKTETGTATKVGAGRQINFQAGKNLEVKRDGDNIIYATSDDLSVNNITVADNGSIKIGNTNITNGAVSNLTTHLESPVKVEGDVANATKTADLAANLTNIKAPDYKGKDAATVEDVLKAGWNLQANGKAVDAVTHGNNVNFASEDRSVEITPTTDGNTSTINLSVNATNVVKQVTGNVSANMTTGKAVVGKDGNENTSTDAGNKVATVGDVANTINNTGWITKTTDGTNVTVNPGDRVEYVDGKGTKANVTVNSTTGQDVVNVTYDVKTDGTTVTVNNDGNLTVVTGNITKASDDVTQPNAGKVTVTTGDENKVATVKNVADAINSAGWIVNTGKADNQDSFKTETGTPTKVGAGDNVNFQAGKNLEVKRDGQNIIYATSEDLDAKTITVTTVKVGNDGKDGKPGV